MNINKIDYNNTAFVLIKPPTRIISTHKIKNKQQHIELIETARSKSCLLYYSGIVNRDGKNYATDPLILDENTIITMVDQQLEPVIITVEDKPGDFKAPKAISPAVETDDLRCPFCNKKMSSTPGRTLHVKHKHPELFDQYKATQ
jgi:hypothetical protein